MNNSTVLCTSAVKSVSYVFYSSPAMSSENSCSISVSSGSASEVSNWAGHSDSNSDGWCDNCGAELYSHEIEEEDPIEEDPVDTVDPFTDVYVTDYYADAVSWAYESGITLGTSDTTFSPAQTCTRAQVISFLYRLADSPEVGGSDETPFTDVGESAYYLDAVIWAVANGVTSGTSETTFSPDSTCTRAQIVTFLYRDLA